MGQYQKKLYTELESTYPEFVEDFNKEYSKQKIALQLVELRLETGLSQRKYAKANELMQNKVSILELLFPFSRMETLFCISSFALAYFL